MFTRPVPGSINNIPACQNSNFDGSVLYDYIKTIEPSIALRRATFQRDSEEFAYSNPTWGITASKRMYYNNSYILTESRPAYTC